LWGWGLLRPSKKKVPPYGGVLTIPHDVSVRIGQARSAPWREGRGIMPRFRQGTRGGDRWWGLTANEERSGRKPRATSGSERAAVPLARPWLHRNEMQDLLRVTRVGVGSGSRRSAWPAHALSWQAEERAGAKR
jgi:hypothetical protein